MAKQNKMTEEELISLIDQHVTDALGYDDAISTQREKAMEYYYGLPFGNEVEGRSQFVSSDVADTIEWIMPSLMRVFALAVGMMGFAFDLRESIAILQFKGETTEQRLERAIERTDNSFDEIMSHLIRLEEKIDDILLANNPMDQKSAR